MENTHNTEELSEVEVENTGSVTANTEELSEVGISNTPEVEHTHNTEELSEAEVENTGSVTASVPVIVHGTWGPDKHGSGNMLELGHFETLVIADTAEVGDSMVDIARAIARPQTYVTKYFKTLEVKNTNNTEEISDIQETFSSKEVHVVVEQWTFLLYYCKAS